MWESARVGKGEDPYPSGRPGMLLRGWSWFCQNKKCSASPVDPFSAPRLPSRVVPALRLFTHSVPPHPSTPAPGVLSDPWL